MPSTCCCVPGCSLRGGHLFPSDRKQSDAWIVAIKRDKWKPNKTSVVCRAHFTDADYYGKNNYGTYFFIIIRSNTTTGTVRRKN